jgi:hypothetical protein
MSQRRRAALITALLGITASVASVSGASAAGNAVPVTADDTLSFYAQHGIGGGGFVRVLRNDTDDADDLAICRVSSNNPRHVDAQIIETGLEVTAVRTKPGTYTLTYQACDYSYLVPATLTVTIKKPGEVTLHKIADRPGRLKARNPNDVSAFLGWGPRRLDHLDGHVRLAPHSTRVITVHRHRIRWVAAIAGPEESLFVGYGLIRHIALPPASRPAPGEPLPLVLRDWRRRTTPGSAGQAGSSSLGSAPVDPTTVAPPTTTGDHLTWWSGSSSRQVHVLANDSDPQGQSLDVCRLPQQRYNAAFSAYVSGFALAVRSRPDAEGTSTLTYYACNLARLAPGKLTVTLKRADPLEVHAVPGAPGTVHVVNRNAVRVLVHLRHRRNVRSGYVPAHGSRDFQVEWHSLSWHGVIGHHHGDAGSGRLVGIPLPTS